MRLVSVQDLNLASQSVVGNLYLTCTKPRFQTPPRKIGIILPALLLCLLISNKILDFNSGALHIALKEAQKRKEKQ